MVHQAHELPVQSHATSAGVPGINGQSETPTAQHVMVTSPGQLPTANHELLSRLQTTAVAFGSVSVHVNGRNLIPVGRKEVRWQDGQNLDGITNESVYIQEKPPGNNQNSSESGRSVDGAVVVMDANREKDIKKQIINQGSSSLPRDRATVSSANCADKKRDAADGYEDHKPRVLARKRKLVSDFETAIKIYTYI